MRLSLCLATILSMTSTTATAEVVDPSKDPDLKLRLDGTEYLVQWFLIEENTLRALNADAKAYYEAVKTVEEQQEELEKAAYTINFLKKDNHALHKENNQLKRDIFNLENPPWYKQPPVWGSIGVALGVGATVAALAMGGAF